MPIFYLRIALPRENCLKGRSVPIVTVNVDVDHRSAVSRVPVQIESIDRFESGLKNINFKVFS